MGDRALGESVGRTPAHCCAQCTCGPLPGLRAAGGHAPPIPPPLLTSPPSGLRSSWPRRRWRDGARVARIWLRTAGGGERGQRCGYGKHRGKCRERHEERADGDTAGQQTDDAVEQGEAEGSGARWRQRQRERGSGRAHRRGGARSASTTAAGTNARTAGCTNICQHNRRRSECKDCGGASICHHNRRRATARAAGAMLASASMAA